MEVKLNTVLDLIKILYELKIRSLRDLAQETISYRDYLDLITPAEETIESLSKYVINFGTELKEE